MSDAATPVERLFASLRKAGLPEVPERFSVAPLHQEIPADAMAAMDELVDVFERVTARPRWREAALRGAPRFARHGHGEACFFSAWDFHLPPDEPRGPQLIELNDNGSGFVVAALANRLAWDAFGLAARSDLEPPEDVADFRRRVVAMVERQWSQWSHWSGWSEGRARAGEVVAPRPQGELLILDDADSLREGRFRRELELLGDALREAGFACERAAPGELAWDGRRLRRAGHEVALVLNRSTDFFWDGAAFAPLRAAWGAGAVCVAPNPATYATRSDKRLLEPLSCPERDDEWGIRPEERRVLAARVPETRVLRPENVDELAAHKEEWVFKPLHGFAGRGLLPSAQVGRARLRRLLEKGSGYVAQRRVAKSTLRVPGDVATGGEPAGLWTDVRVWAVRSRRYLVSGRASRRPDRLDLAPPGGWLPTFVRR